MNIVVLVKQVPDSGAERNLRSDDNTVDRASANNVINEMDEYAIEEALKIQEAHGGEVTVLTMGPESATEAIRKALSMGADKAVHLTDESLHGSDAIQTSAALAAVIKTLEADLVDEDSDPDPALETSVPFEVRPGTQSGTESVLGGRGIPSLRGTGRGDLVVRVVVETPTRLDEQQEAMLRELASVRDEESPDGRARAPQKSVFTKLRDAFK